MIHPIPSTSSRPQRQAVYGLLALLGSALAAQAPSPWTVLDVPGGVQPNAIQQIGKIITYTEPNQVTAYSGFAHAWVPLATSGPANVRVGNDLALAIDGTTFNAFASYTARWQSITLGPGATLLNPTNQRNDSIWLVRDGNDLWAFTAFRGTWTRITASGGALVQTERHVAMVVDGTTLHGLSALHDAWVTTQAPAAPTVFRARGTAAVVASAAGIHGFSALANAWTTFSAPGANPQIAADDDVQVIFDGTTYVGFSGLRGEFAQTTLPANATLRLEETLCHATDNSTQHWVYTAVRNAWTTLPSAPGATVLLGSNALLLGLPDRVHAYSAMRDNVATALGQFPITALSRSVASMQDSNGIKFYSAILGAWFDAPAGTTSEISDVAGFVHTPTGISAFSSRTGRFTALPVTPPLSTVIAIGNAVQAVVAGNTLHVFDPRRERWLSAPLQGTPQIGTHRTTLLVIDGTRAYGYGSFSSHLTPVTLPGPATIVRPNSESGSLDVANAVFAHSSVPDLLTLWQYPEFRRIYVTGTPLEVQIQARDGAGFLFLGLRPLATPVAFGGLGLLELDPAALLLLSGLPMSIVQNHGRLVLPVPDSRWLRGLEISLQGVVLPASGSPYFTQSTSVALF